jgi:hypothetical protein
VALPGSGFAGEAELPAAATDVSGLDLPALLAEGEDRVVEAEAADRGALVVGMPFAVEEKLEESSALSA